MAAKSYFEDLIETLRIENNRKTQVANLINVFSLYYLCDHFYGTEPREYNFNPGDKTDLLRARDISVIKEFDIVHVQVNYFNKFCTEILPLIPHKFVLTTGQWQLPYIQKSSLTDHVLEHHNVALWVSQNPIYDNCPKYYAFPYGLNHLSIHNYANALLRPPTVKNKSIIFLTIRRTHPCRYKFPLLNEIDVNQYYTEISRSEFIISPIGDRDDAYRHWEAIGLGTIPISNVGIFYKNIFGDNMYYCDIDELVRIYETNEISTSYHTPNKDMISFKYHQDLVHNRIQKCRE